MGLRTIAGTSELTYSTSQGAPMPCSRSKKLVSRVSVRVNTMGCNSISSSMCSTRFRRTRSIPPNSTLVVSNATRIAGRFGLLAVSDNGGRRRGACRHPVERRGEGKRQREEHRVRLAEKERRNELGAEANQQQTR